MIKANELRIGNYIQGKPLSIPRMQINSDGITQITGYGISVIESDTNDSMGFNPIPLTEQWLLDFGFDNTIDEPIEGGELLVFFNGNVSVEITPDKLGLNNTFTICIYKDVIDEKGEYAMQGEYEKEIEHVHQLQNIFYYFTDLELTLKQPII